MSSQVNLDHFQRAARTYEQSAGRLTRTVSRHILANLLHTPLLPASVVLDDAAGPGITATEILAALPPDRRPGTIHATDISPAMIEELARKGHSEIQGSVMDMQQLDFTRETFTHIFCCFALTSAKDATQTARELYRTLRPGGSAYVTTWAQLDWIPIVDEALHVVKPDAPPYHGLYDPAWHTAEKLHSVLVSGGFDQDRVRVVRYETYVSSDYWDGTLEFVRGGLISGQLTKDWEADQKQRFDDLLTARIEQERQKGGDVAQPCWIAIAVK